MKPPNKEAVSPSELWTKLCEPRPSEVIPFPRKDKQGNSVGDIRIQVLRMEDHNRARLLATKALKDSVKEAGLADLTRDENETESVKEVLGDLIANELLCMACLSVESHGEDEMGNPIYARIFHTPKQIRSVLTADETVILFNAYRQVQWNYGPFEKTLNDDDDIEAWVTRLAEGGSEFPLLVLPLPQLAELTLGLSEKIYSLCQILESQRSDLPPTLIADLENCFTAIFSFGKLPSKTTLTLEETLQKISPEESLELATRMAAEQKRIRESGM